MSSHFISTLERSLPVPPSQAHPVTAEVEALEVRGSYWNDYYSRPQKRVPPSQFAAFVAGEFSGHDLVIDIGCGNGRDTVFFAQLGFKTLGIDGSQSAIEHCRSLVQGSDRSDSYNAFMCCNVLDLRDDAALLAKLRSAKKVLYSRFFLHAIDAHEETAFFDFAFAAMREGDVLAIEFRTSEDAGRAKVTGAHFRRYVDAQALVQAVVDRHGAQVLYLTEGTGFAKYKADDAYVCRMVLASAAGA